MMADPVLAPDTSQIFAHLTHITRRWHELNFPCVVEIVFLTPHDKAQVRHVTRFGIEPEKLKEAAEHVAGMNQHKLNAYAVVNPVDGTKKLLQGNRASAPDILASFFHFADADDAEAAENIRNFVGPKCTFFVLTGTVPTQRPHVYWELEQPEFDLAAWSKRQSIIASILKTDSVIDAPRIMRLGGTINWPKPQKRERGYIPELTSLKIYTPEERPPVSVERMERAFGQVPLSVQAASKTYRPLTEDFGGEFSGKPSLERDEQLELIRTGQSWHTPMVKLVGSYVARGLSDDEIHAITDSFTWPGYTVEDTRAEVQTAIDGARKKKFDERAKPEQNQFRELTDSEKDAIAPALFRPWKVKDLSAIPHPEFVYSDFYARGYTSVTIAPPKVGKSMLGLAEAIDMTTGRGFLTGVRRDPLRVVYYNAEDDENVIDSRVSALLTHYGIEQSEIEDRLFPTSGVDMPDFYMVSGQEGVINEALFVSIEKFIKETGADALIFDPLQDLSRSPETNEVFRLLGQRLRRMASTCGVALGLIHHTRKIAPGTQASIDDARGGSALRGTARFNRLLNPMTEDEAMKSGVANHRYYFRIGDMESNLAPPSADVNRWFEKVSVLTENGHFIGAVQPWKWPDAFDGVSREDARKVQLAIGEMEDDPPLESIQSNRWAGYVVASLLGLDVDDKAAKARVQNMLKTWIKTEVLTVVEVRNARAGRDVKAIIPGPNNPLTEAKE